jgi:hypothetical protein
MPERPCSHLIHLAGSTEAKGMSHIEEGLKKECWEIAGEGQIPGVDNP